MKYMQVKQENKEMKIVVLAGGTSTEREISVVSGTGVCKALRQEGQQAILVDVFCGLADTDPDTAFDGDYDVDQAAAYIRSFDGSIKEMIESRREFFGPNVIALCQAADIVFMALHGANGEDGKVQAAFDLFGIKYTGTGYLSSALAMDKTMSKYMMQAQDIPMPRGFSLRRDEKLVLPADKDLSYPVIVKPCCGGSSVGINIANNDDEYINAAKEAFSLEEEAVIEEYISGREFSVAVIDKEAYPVIEIAPLSGFYDYKNKYSAGSTVETCPAELSGEITKAMQETAVRAAEAMGITGYCRLDFMMREDGRFYVLEANTLPGMTPTSLIPQEAKALGITYSRLCMKLVDISMKKYQ